MTVDEILATGKYTDKRGREWDYFDMRVDYDRWKRWESRGEEDLILDPDEMRLLIERDQHECDSLGLTCCPEHPVVSVLRHPDTGAWIVFDRFGIERVGPEYHEWSDALAAARALAVGE